MKLLAPPLRCRAGSRRGGLAVFEDLPLLCGCADGREPGCDAGCD